MSKTALLFAGQGAQVVGMGKDLAEKFPSAKTWFDRANAALVTISPPFVSMARNRS